jgi:hypothetical protein
VTDRIKLLGTLASFVVVGVLVGLALGEENRLLALLMAAPATICAGWGIADIWDRP